MRRRQDELQVELFLKYIKIIINNYKIHLGNIENSKEQDFWYEKQKQW